MARDGFPVPGPVRAGRSLTWLFGLVLACLALVLGLRVYFTQLQEDLDARLANERARLFVGEEVLRGIHGVEMDLHRMAATANEAGFRRARRSLGDGLAKLHHDIGVLERGGTVRRQIHLNLEGQDEMVSDATYRPGERSYVMEVIEILPLLDQANSLADELEALLQRRWATRERNDARAFLAVEDDVGVFLKRMPPYFERLRENANRLFFESGQRLAELQAELAARRRTLQWAEMALLALVLVAAGFATVFFVRRLNLANDRLANAVDAMRAARDMAERASRAKSEFVSRMSHELRTPLNAIIGFGELLEGEPLQPSQASYVRLINASGRHLLELVNQVLDLAKIEAGGLRLERIPFDLPATVEAVRQMIAERVAGKGIAFVATVDPGLPRYVEGDPTRLRQILINLLMNAVKFTEQGSVEMRAAPDGDRLYFSVRDSGIGMDQQALAKLFQPFVQADGTITRRFGGSGLGLVIARELVEAMGGAVEVESAPGTGTCFWFWVPLRPAAAPPVPIPVPVIDDGCGVADLLDGPVLLVDDNHVNQQLAAAMLDRLGVSHDVAGNGEECLARLAGGAYAMVLMDVEMPVMDGITAAARIRGGEAPGGRRLPIIAMTANALQEDRERCMAAGMDGYVAKPVSLASLRQEICRVLGAAGTSPRAPAPVAETAPAADDLPWSRARALQLLDGDEKLLRVAAGMYVSEGAIRRGEMVAAMAAADWPALVRIAHTMKGLFATFACASGRAAAAALEAACRGGAPAVAEIADLAERVSGHDEDLCAALAAEFARPTETK